MKLGINLLGLPSVREGGSGFYSEMLVRGLARLDEHHLVVMCGERTAVELSDLDGAAELLAVPDVPATANPLERAWRGAGAAGRLMRSLRETGLYRERGHEPPPQALDDCAVVHYPLSFMTAPRHQAASVVTALDLQHLELPGNFTRADRLLRRVRWHAALRRADRVIAISTHTAGALVERLGLEYARIDVIPLACSDAFFSPLPDVELPYTEFLVYPAAPRPAKNHRRLLRAFSRVRARHPELRLVLCGPDRQDWTPVARACHEEGVADHVVLAGHLSLDALRAHYAAARLLVFPSLFEGFGLPVLEAMASRCIVACSDADGLPELLDGCGLLFDPEDEGAIEAAIETALALNPGVAEDTAERGRRRAEQFRVERMVERTMASYARAVPPYVS